MILSRVFYVIASIVFLLGGFVFLTPALLTPDILFPERIDSAYIVFHTAKDDGLSDSMLFDPSEIGLKFSGMKIQSKDGITLDGWYISSPDTPANTVIIIHDLNESKILYIDQLKQFHDRGLNVCAFDLRAHGNSGGDEFTPGIPAVDDMKLIVDSVLARKETRHVVFMGIGIGAAIALQSAVYDDRCQGLILQSPFNKYETFLDRYAGSKWGIMRKIWYPVFKRRAESMLQYPINQLDLRKIASYVTIPSLFIIGSDDEKVFTSETLQVYDASATEKKELFLVRNANHQNIATSGGEQYYNRIAAFLISNLPKEQKVTRYKKLASND